MTCRFNITIKVQNCKYIEIIGYTDDTSKDKEQAIKKAESLCKRRKYINYNINDNKK